MVAEKASTPSRRLPAWSLSSRGIVGAAGRGSTPAPASSATFRPKVTAGPRPALHAARARRGGRHRRPRHHRRVLPGVKARRYAPSAARLAALTPAPRALHNGQLSDRNHATARNATASERRDLVLVGRRASFPAGRASDTERWLAQWAHYVGPGIEYPGFVDETPVPALPLVGMLVLAGILAAAGAGSARIRGDGSDPR